MLAGALGKAVLFRNKLIDLSDIVPDSILSVLSAPINFTVSNGDTISFNLNGLDTSAVVSVINVTDSNTLLDSFIFTTAYTEAAKP